MDTCLSLRAIMERGNESIGQALNEGVLNCLTRSLSNCVLRFVDDRKILLFLYPVITFVSNMIEKDK